MRFGRRDGGVAVDEAADSALDSVGADRLRAMKQRLAQAEQPAVPATEPQRRTRPALADNGFALLELPIASAAPAINEAYDRLSFEPDRDEARLTAARAALMAPRDRLAAEIGWAPGLARLSLDALIVALRANDADTLQSLHGKTTGLTRLNIGHALLDMDPSDVQAASSLLSDARDVDAEAMLDLLDEARFAVREREIDRALFDACLDDHARKLGAQAALTFAATPTGRTALTRSLQAMGSPVSRFDTCLRDALLNGYGQEIAQTLDQSHGRIMASIEALKTDPHSYIHAASLSTALDMWSTLRRPMQIHEASRGLDDPASGEIFAAIRSLSITLSNDHEQHQIALRLARALLSSFALVPIHRATLERELPTLIGNVAVKRAEQLHEIALAELKSFARQVEAGGLDGTGGLAGSINALVADVEGLKNESALELVFLTLRDIALQLNNQTRERRAAYAMIVWLTRQSPPRTVAQKLEEDLRHFGVDAAVAVREEAGDTQASNTSRAPTQFGRSGRSSETAPPLPPLPSGTRAPRAPQPPMEKSAFGFLKGLLAIVMLLGVLYGRSTHRAERERQRAAAIEQSYTSTVTPAAPVMRATPPYTPPSYTRDVRSAEDAEALLDRARARALRRAGLDLETGTATRPRFVPGKPMLDAEPGVQP